MGLSTSDDAAVYKVSEEVAMIQTVDFFTPVVDDPYTFGMIAACNALSDVYAMGGIPKVALNIVGFPNCLDPEILGDIMAGGAEKVKESGALLIGGHSIQNDDPLYGLCVSGFVHPERIQKNYGAKPGDVLILTKQIGSGIINTAVKAELASEKAMEEAVRVMASLNRKAKEAMDPFHVHACTDITGFGLLGHAMEMAEASKVSFELHFRNIPLIEAAKEYAELGLVPAGAYRNRKYTENKLSILGISDTDADLLFDPQSSGGLLYAIPAEEKDSAMDALLAAGLETKAEVIGSVEPLEEKFITVKP